MPQYDHDAIRKAYPNVIIIDDAQDPGVFDANGDVINIVQSNVDAARVELDKLKYKKDRVIGIGTTEGYPDIGTQLDWLYHDMKNGTLNTSGQWYVGITTVKTNIPKPS
tara:strand:+ start:484 stop:810 length:327 start_codon:yes stop_codon:yes gene_type:complete